jgi:hypothetical protein
MSSSKGKSFFATLPGILTGIAALITAIGGLYAITQQRSASEAADPASSNFGESSPSSEPVEQRGDELVLFEDDFDTQRIWQPVSTADRGNAFYRDGSYILQNNTDQLSFFYRMRSAGLFPSNVRIGIDARLLKGRLDKSFGLLFAARDDAFANAYGFFVRGEGVYQLWRWTENRGELLLSISDPSSVYVGLHRVNHLEVEVRGSTIVYYANGHRLGEYEATDDVRGYVGLCTDSPGLEVAFDNLRVTQLRER